MSVGRHRSQVARVIPSVLVDGLARGLLVLVVAQHHVHAACHYLALRVHGVGRQYLHLHVVDGGSARTGLEVVIVAIRDERCTLGSAVAHGDGELDALQKLLYFLIQRCSAHDDLVGAAAKGIVHFLTDTLLHLLRHDGHLQQQLHGVALYLGEHALADDFLDNQGYCNDHVRLDLLESLGDDCRRRQAGEEVEMIARTEWEQELHRHAIHVGHRQDAQRAREFRHVYA